MSTRRKNLNFHLYSLKITKDYKVRVSQASGLFTPVENKVLGLKQTTEKDLMEWMGQHKYVKEEVRGVKLVVENEKSEKTRRRRT